LGINLALVLTLLTLFTGIVVAMDKLVWKTADQDGRTAPGVLSTVVEYSRSFFPVLIFRTGYSLIHFRAIPNSVRFDETDAGCW